MQNDKFGQSGLQKYEQPTKVFCLIENLEEFFSEIKSSSNLKKFCHRERNYSIQRQGEENKGGLPQGLYSIECKESGSLLNGNLKKHRLGVNAWGNYHWRLLPDKNTDMRGRKPLSFTIHGGSDAQSAGCIDLTSQDTVFRKYLQSTGLPRIYVLSSTNRKM